MTARPPTLEKWITEFLEILGCEPIRQTHEPYDEGHDLGACQDELMIVIAKSPRSSRTLRPYDREAPRVGRLISARNSVTPKVMATAQTMPATAVSVRTCASGTNLWTLLMPARDAPMPITIALITVRAARTASVTSR